MASRSGRIDAVLASRPRRVAAALAVSALVHLPALLTTRPINVDEAYIAIMGRMQLSGDELYRTLVDRKPPLMLWAYRVMVPSSWSLWWVHLALVVLVATNGLVIAAIAQRLGADRYTAALAATLAIVGTAMFGPPDAHASNFELWGLVPASVAVLCALRADTTRTWWCWSLAAGLFVGLATNTKQPYVFTFAVIVVALPRARRILATVLAGSALVAVTAFLAGATDWSGYWRWVWLGNGDYVKVGIGATLLLALRQVGIFALLQLPIVAAAWGLRRTAARRAVLVCSVWALSAGVGVVSGLRFFGHYFQQVVPPLALAAAFGVAAAPKGTWLTARRLLVACGVWTIALWSLCFVPSLGIQRAPAALVHGIDASTGRSDRVLVWGRLPDASVAARRLPSGRFVHHAYLTGLWASGHGDPDPARDDPFAGRWHDFLDDLHREPPTLIVDASSIVDGWHHYPVTSTPLADLVRTCYRSAAAIDGLPAWRRTTVCR